MLPRARPADAVPTGLRTPVARVTKEQSMGLRRFFLQASRRRILRTMNPQARARTPARRRWIRGSLAALAVGLLGFCLAAYAQREFRTYLSFEGEDGADHLPSDYRVPGEFVVGRLMYPSTRFGYFGGGDWRQGGTSWAVDYPRGDRTFAQILRRQGNVGR